MLPLAAVLASCASLPTPAADAPASTVRIDSSEDTGSTDDDSGADTSVPGDSGPPGDIVECEVGVDECNGLDDDGDGWVDECCHAALAGEVAVELADVMLTRTPEGPFLRSEWSIGDFDGDGRNDLGLAYPGGVPGSEYCANSRLFAARFPATDTAVAVTELVSVANGDGLGCVGKGAHIVGDGNADGFVDLLVHDGEFEARVVPGPLEPVVALSGTAAQIDLPGDGWIFAARWVGDLDGIPGDEIGVGQSLVDYDDNAEFYVSGRVFVFSGAPTSTLGEEHATATIYWKNKGAELGDHVAGLGDLDGDGIDELGLDGGYVYYGPVLGDLGWGTEDIALCANGGCASSDLRSSAALGDADGDGRDDAALGGCFKSAERIDSCGFVVISDGQPSVSYTSEVLRRGERPYGDEGPIGWSIATGDFDGDGWPDIAVGGGPHREDWPSTAVFVEYGPFEGVRDLGGGAWIPSPPDADYVGGHYWGLAAGDVNGDGFTDLGVGQTSQAGTEDVRAWLFLGGPG